MKSIDEAESQLVLDLSKAIFKAQDSGLSLSRVIGSIECAKSGLLISFGNAVKEDMDEEIRERMERN